VFWKQITPAIASIHVRKSTNMWLRSANAIIFSTNLCIIIYC